MVICHAESKDYLAPVLTWGQNRYGADPEKRDAFLRMVAELFTQGGGEANTEAVLAMCSAAIVDAENNRDHEGFVAIGRIIEALSPPPEDRKEKPRPGNLLSEGGMVRFSSVSSRWDRNTYRHWNLLGFRSGHFHTNDEENPWVEVTLPHFGLLSRIEIVNMNHHQSRAIPLAVQVSIDGENWKEVMVVEKTQPAWDIDLRRKRIRARYVRLMKKGKGILHLQNIRIYGSRLS